MDKDTFILPQHKLSHIQKIGGLILVIALGLLITLIAIRLFHRGRLLPGTSAYGVYLGSATREEAITLLTRETARYTSDARIVINTQGGSPSSLSVQALGVSYDPAAAVDQAYSIGRSGNPFRQIGEELGLMVGLVSVPRGPLDFDSQAAYAAVAAPYSSLNQPVRDARYNYSGAGVTLTESVTGSRFRLARYIDDLESVLGSLDRTAISLQSYQIEPAVTSSSLVEQKSEVQAVVSQPLVLKDGARSWTISQDEILGWYSAPLDARSVMSQQLDDYYRLLPVSTSQISIDQSRIAASLVTMAGQIEQTAVDAKLTISGDRASVFQRSQDGRSLDRAASAKLIKEHLASRSAAPVTLAVAVTKAQVSDDTIDKLGIYELLSEGVSYFPGSSANRITNVRVGQALYNNYLLKPDETFSFGEILGDVGPEQGYKPGLVILGNKVASQYGGGLCQVSSTAFRAALLAGLPIVERVNHSYAVDYYTQPYGVPGVDATIYYPEVDFKFRNDTGSHILIQTEMKGTTLKFRFYGTKKKEGVIRGPNFITGSNDVNQPSRTVFYRDIVVNGQVTKTDTFYTNYKSALDFPRVD